MAHWKYKPSQRLVYDQYEFYFDNAYELGELVAESECFMPNPFIRDTFDSDQFVLGYDTKMQEISELKNGEVR